MKNKIKEHLSTYPKIYSIARNVRFISEDIKKYLRLILSTPFLLIPIKNKKIVVCNYFGKGYGDNGKYIVREIIRQGLDYDIVWLLKKDLVGNSDFPSEVRIEKYGSLKGLYELATAKVWIDNSRKTFYPFKRRKQYYIQTWHGGVSMKRVEKDVKDNLGKSYVAIAKKDSQMADLFISNSKVCTEMYRSSFWYDGDILESGSPRCDVLLDNKKSINKKVKDFFNIEENTKVIIYAPTFRDSSKTEVYNIDFKNLILTLNRRFGGEWKVLIRLHPNISVKKNFIEYTNEIIDATDYSDMYELLATSDILITDYSSTMFEFSITGKPVFLYATDIEEYLKERNFYFNIKSLPYTLAMNNNQLLKSIENFEEKKYTFLLNEFLSKIGITENGNASQEIVHIIKNKITE